ncbi:MAG TPA: alpha/beta hydrolase domain-containing protein, partial [Gemmatimonadaceae bacterium]
TLAARQLVSADSRAMPMIPGVAIARQPYTPHRLSFGNAWDKRVITQEPPVVGAPYTVLVPVADSIGNEAGGIRSVELRVPLATYFPWQLRATPPTDRLVSFQGTFVPLPRTEADRRNRGDSRPSVERLYPSRAAFLGAVDGATQALVAERFLLPEDRAVARDRMASVWDWVMAH